MTPLAINSPAAQTTDRYATFNKSDHYESKSISDDS
jgi:hypothetical protein